MNEKKKRILVMGRKLGMTRLYDSIGRHIAVTAIGVGPCPVVRIKDVEKDGYAAVQIAAEETLLARLTRATAGHYGKNGVKPHRRLSELRISAGDATAYEMGEIFDLSRFREGERVDVSGITKGHGFQGVMKRHGFSGGPASHGSMFHRRGGSYGMREEPGRIYKGRKMPGHMGCDRQTVQNLSVIRVLPEQGLLFLKGSVVGANGNWVKVRTAKKG
jgi:large subunit ribosomal protein L3